MANKYERVCVCTCAHETLGCFKAVRFVPAITAVSVSHPCRLECPHNEGRGQQELYDPGQQQVCPGQLQVTPQQSPQLSLLLTLPMARRPSRGNIIPDLLQMCWQLATVRITALACHPTLCCLRINMQGNKRTSFSLNPNHPSCTTLRRQASP